MSVLEYGWLKNTNDNMFIGHGVQPLVVKMRHALMPQVQIITFCNGV
jgi:hypothetical protein